MAWLKVPLSELDRYERINEEYCGPGKPLQNRSLDDLFQRAKEEKSNIEGYFNMLGNDLRTSLPTWLRSV